MWYLVGIIGAILTSFGFLPQVLKMWKNKSAKDVSHITFIQFTAGCVFWLAYGLSRRDMVIIGANIVTLSTLSVALTLYVRYIRTKAL